MDLSIIIPTYNRANTLKICLERLSQCHFNGAYEVILVDDGSTDSTEYVAKSSKLNLRYLKQKNKGQGTARNVGINKASGKIILLIGDDILPARNMLREHYKSHMDNSAKNIAVLGKVEWDPDMEISEIMKWSTNEILTFGKFGGHQFAYNLLTHNNFTNYRFFYTSNISLKSPLLKKHPFNEKFKSYGWEDIELGLRLQKTENLKILYNANAKGYHHHYMNIANLKKRMLNIGKSAKIFESIHPETNVIPKGSKLIIFKLISNPFTLFFLKMFKTIMPGLGTAPYFYALSKKYLLLGLKGKIR